MNFYKRDKSRIYFQSMIDGLLYSCQFVWGLCFSAGGRMMMDCDGLVRSSAAARIPIQFVASSPSSAQRDVEHLEERDPPHQPRFHHHRHQHHGQQQQQQSARDNHDASSINGRLTSPQCSLSRLHSTETAFPRPGRRPLSNTTATHDQRPLSLPCRRSRQRVRPSDNQCPVVTCHITLTIGRVIRTHDK